jgi:chemotaxis regulatin CheY-phosphate phosphatase CheZ
MMAAADAARRKELFSDSEATLRQVQGVLADFGAVSGNDDGSDECGHGGARRAAGLTDLVEILMTTYGEIMSVIDSLRKSRGMLEQAAMERLKSTHAKLAEVSSATEMAATGMLDGLDRALVLVDHLEAADESRDPGEGPRLRGDLREELHALISLLQFQDITAQQLGYAGAVLLDIEDRLVELARIFDVTGVGQRAATDGGDSERDARLKDTHSTCDPEASHFDSQSRQALADKIFR